MSFARPDLLPFVITVPLLIAASIWLYARRRRNAALQLGEPRLLARIGGGTLLNFPLSRLLLLCGAAASLAFAAAGPRWGQRALDGSSLALNVVIATDISKSMLAEDVEPNRLERARLFSRRLLRDLPGDRFGLVVFAGRAYVLSPLTVDHSAVELYLDALDPSMVSQGGSSLGAAVAQATDLVRGSDNSGGDRAVVLLTDGEALEDEAAVRDAAERAARAGVRFVTVGVGTERGSNLPDIDPNTGEQVGLKRDENGNVVVSRLDEAMLRLVAEETGGTFVRLEEGNALDRVVDELQGMQRAEGENAQRVQPIERFWIFALLGLLLLVADALLHGPSLRAAQPVAPRSAGTVTPRRRRVRTAAVLVLACTALAFGVGDVERGNRLYREGRYEEAAAAYQRAIADGNTSPQVQYNLGTSLLALGRYDEAERHFQAALAGVDPELRERTFYNLGNRFLQEARANGSDLQRQGQLLDGAIEAYKRTLRIAPQDVDAKWNLELAQRERDENRQQQSMPQQSQQDREQEQDQQNQGEQQGQGSGSNPSQSQSGEGEDAGAQMQQEPMAREQADRILSAIEQDERELTREKLRRGQRRTPVLRDW